jgi:dienelactone hydrolase
MELSMTRNLLPISLVILMSALSAKTQAAPPAGEFPPVDKLPVVKNLPDPFLFADGTRVKTKEDWARRRAELQAAILHYEYGNLPPAPGNTVGVERVSSNYRELPNVQHRVFTISCGPDHKVAFTLDLLIPKTKGPHPVILCGDLGWGKTPDDIAAEVIKRGYILVEFDRTELAPDNFGYRKTGLFVAYPEADCGALAAWAWGFHRCVDFLLTLNDVDKEKIAVTGHSRGGKAAILAGATDTRVALTAPNCSGCGGAGCYHFQAPKSEDIVAITKNFPFWFAPSFEKNFVETTADKDAKGQPIRVSHIDRLPIDQHELKALCAPRAFLETEALGDLWANPEGSRQTWLAAREVYKFLGVPEKIGIFYRQGQHQHNADDWNVLLDFADQIFLGKKSDRNFEANPFPNTPKTFDWSAPQ